MKLADTQDLGSCAARRRGSSPRAATDRLMELPSTAARWGCSLVWVIPCDSVPVAFVHLLHRLLQMRVRRNEIEPKRSMKYRLLMLGPPGPVLLDQSVSLLGRLLWGNRGEAQRQAVGAQQDEEGVRVGSGAIGLQVQPASLVPTRERGETKKPGNSESQGGGGLKPFPGAIGSEYRSVAVCSW